jgi:Txe/YoeB family toxin of Txe-Axe toxin-antitoxin module
LSSLSISHDLFTNPETIDENTQTSELKELIKKKDKKIRRLQKKVLRQAKTIKGLMATLRPDCTDAFSRRNAKYFACFF